MVAAVSRPQRSARSQSFGGSSERSPHKLRLPPSAEDVLLWLFVRLEGEVGLRSNFGDMCRRLEASTVRGDRPLSELEPKTTGLDLAGNDLVDAVSSIRLALADSRFRSKRPKLPLSERVPRAMMHVRSGSAHASCPDQPFESWACWSNHGLLHGKPRLGQAVLDARRALLRMLAGGERAHVVTLAVMYGAEPETAPDPSAKPETGEDGKPLPPEPPPWRWVKDFGMLGDLVRLAPMTPTVLVHAARLSDEARESVHVEAFQRGMREAESTPRAAAVARAALDRVLLHDDGSDDYARLIALATERVRRCELAARAPRLTLDSVVRHAAESRLTTGAVDALRDLLLPRSGEAKERRATRKAMTKQIVAEAEQMLIAASNAYRAAKKSLLAAIPRQPGTWGPAWEPRARLMQVIGYRNDAAVLSCGHYVSKAGSSARRCRECEGA